MEIYTVKSIGHITEPCETPRVILNGVDSIANTENLSSAKSNHCVDETLANSVGSVVGKAITLEDEVDDQFFYIFAALPRTPYAV